jgi:uncharacterized membrane protein
MDGYGGIDDDVEEKLKLANFIIISCVLGIYAVSLVVFYFKTRIEDLDRIMIITVFALLVCFVFKFVISMLVLNF